MDLELRQRLVREIVATEGHQAVISDISLDESGSGTITYQYDRGAIVRS